VTVIPCKALIMLVSRTDAVGTAVEALSPEVVGIISSQDFSDRWPGRARTWSPG
jgi:hypothetical protein